MPNTSRQITSNRVRAAASLLVLVAAGLGVGLTRTLAGGAAAATPVTHTVVIENMRFSPAEISVLPGERVLFKNSDLVPHTATSTEPGVFDSRLIEAGKSWTLNCDRAGRIAYRCTFHPTMTGVVVVRKE